MQLHQIPQPFAAFELPPTFKIHGLLHQFVGVSSVKTFSMSLLCPHITSDREATKPIVVAMRRPTMVVGRCMTTAAKRRMNAATKRPKFPDERVRH